MDQFTHDDLKPLIDHTDNPIVSIYMPTIRAGREVRQNATRFKNMIKQAQNRLAELKLEEGPLANQLNKAAELHDNDDWWQHQSDGLAMFLTEDRFEKYRVPLSFAELVTVNTTAHVRPLVRLLQGDGQFYVLAVSQNDVRLLFGTHYSVDELTPDELPSDLRSALNIDEYVSSLQQHSTGKPAMAGSMTFHGHGGSDLDVQKKDEIKQYFHRINDALESYFGTERTPLVFAGVDYLFPIFREACHYNNLVDKAVQGNPDDLKVDELHKHAWEILAPQFEQSRKAAVARFQNSGKEQATTDVLELIAAARQGAIDTLLLDGSQHIWGTIDGESGAFHESKAQAADSEELLNHVAVQTLRTGGTVYSCPTESMPSGESAAAVLRFPVTTS